MCRCVDAFLRCCLWLVIHIYIYISCVIYIYIYIFIASAFLNLFNRDEREDETREVNLS